MVEMTALLEAMGEQGIPLLFLVVSAVMGVIALRKHGSEAQKQRYLPPLARGESKLCFAITEPTAGSNSFRLTALARRDGDRYVLNGQKVFISGANEADALLVVARTTPYGEVRDKRQGLSLFLVPTKSAGVTLQALDVQILHPEKQFSVFFDEVVVPREALLGEEGQGFRYLFDILNPERISGAATAVGLGRLALERAVRYARQRRVFDVPIGAHQGLQHPLAKVKAQLEMASLMAYKAAWLFDQGLSAGAEANMAKFAAAEAAIEACDLAMEVHGGSGFTAECDLITLWPYARLLRTAPVSREMILNYIGEHVLGLPRSY
ncbi:MAG: acyl-CoA dehydrogenase [Candidatus Tectimicrobiota bacterium]|nr:MAG: acyl-CoA dehydrogenase [Candidatus Tectomicrobia bacterium]